jgi:hypothetical protein
MVAQAVVGYLGFKQLDAKLMVPRAGFESHNKNVN